MQAKVLIVEDVREMAELVRLYLQKEGMEAEIFETGETALEAFEKEKFDLVVLDINLPGIDGFEFLQRLRKTSAVPVVIVSARDTDEDMILGLGIGADEFVTKPFSPKVLTARIRAIMRRATDLKATANSVKFGEYLLDLDGYLLKKGALKIPLSTKEFEVLALLATHPGKAMSPRTSIRRCGATSTGTSRLSPSTSRDCGGRSRPTRRFPSFIETVHGMGYRFNREMIHA